MPAPAKDATGVHGEILYVDHFGNLISNVPAALFPAGPFVVTVAGVRIGPVSQTYAVVPRGALVALVDSFGLLEIAVRDGSAHDALACGAGAPIALIPS
jgi:S-adenosylmethionine hydrolase